MKILVSGSTGLVGSALVSSLAGSAHSVVRLVRSEAAIESSQSTTVQWDPAAGTIDAAALEGIDAAVHLAGEGIANRRWSVEQKAKIRDSRVVGTRLLCESLARLAVPPKTLVAASAIGFYGSRGDELVNESSPPGTGFLADVCREWEAATAAAAGAGIRVVHLRIGVVLSANGGALKTMLLPFRLGLGGKIGNGLQYMSWIAIDDMVSAIEFAIASESLAGPVNAVAPNPVTNYEFTKTLGRVLGRPTIFPMPAFAARLAFGELADHLLLASTRVEPARLRASGFPFRHPQLEGALRAALA